MAYIQAEIKRGFLRCIHYESRPTATTLLEALEAYQRQCFQSVKGGRITVSTSGGGYSASFNAPQSSQQITQEQVSALAEEFIKLHETAVSYLKASDNTVTDAQIKDGDKDEEIFKLMVADDSLQTIRSCQNDYTLGRFPSYGPSRY